MHQVCYSIYNGSVVLPAEIRICDELLKILKYYVRDCVKIFLLLSTFPMMIQLSVKSTFLGSKMLILSKSIYSARLNVFLSQILT